MHQLIRPLRTVTLVGLLALLLVGLVIVRVRAEGEAPLAPRTTDLATTFAYQGRLAKDGLPVNGTCDFNFALYDSPAPDPQSPISTVLYPTAVPVNEGVFNVSLDFGAALFVGDDRYLGVAVACPTGSIDYVLLGFQPLTATPHAIRSLSTTNDQVGGPGSGWSLTGNASTNPTTDFIGTIDAVAFEVRVNNSRVYRFEPNATSPNLIGGAPANTVNSGAHGGTIAGGGETTLPNQVTDHYGTVAGGVGNRAGDDDSNTTSAHAATVGGGNGNVASALSSTIAGGFVNVASGDQSVVGGGKWNTASNNNATISGGQENEAAGDGSFVGGGWGNSANASFATISGGGLTTFLDGTTRNRVTDDFGTIGGGGNNWAGDNAGTTDDSPFATVGGGGGNRATGHGSTISGGLLNSAIINASIGGGYSNHASADSATVAGGYGNAASGESSTVGGGWLNVASGAQSTVGGGFGNVAAGDNAAVPGGTGNSATGNYSFAAGRQAKAIHLGSFAWADSQAGDHESPGDNTFSVRAAGGIWFGTGGAAVIGANEFISTSTGAYLTTGGTWTNLSDVNLKTNFSTIDTREVLEKLIAMPVITWNYTAEGDGILRMGPTAQDFYAAYGLGDSDRSIGTIDAQGVAFAAIQGLYATVQDENAGLRAEIAALESENAGLESRLERLESAAGFTSDSNATLPAWMLAALFAAAGLAGAVVLRKVK